MNVYDFLNELNIHFPMKDENKKHIFNKYADLILNKVYEFEAQYNYEKLLDKILCSYTFKTFPPISFIIDLLPSGIAVESLTVQHEGEVVVIVAPDNRIYDFVIKGYGENILDFKKSLLERHKVQISDNEFQYRPLNIYKFPKGSTVFKDRVLIPNNDPNNKQLFTTQHLKYNDGSYAEDLKKII